MQFTDLFPLVVFLLPENQDNGIRAPGYDYEFIPVEESTNAFMEERNLAAFLMVIRTGEGTADTGGYTRLFGGGQFYTFEDHPNILVKKSGYSSTAAGAYQFIIATWRECKRATGLSDFSPASQDAGAVWLLKRAGAYQDVLAGRFDEAVRKCSGTWASLPWSPYGQPTISIEKARTVFSNYGGMFA
jgi:muramidase (phage lysozyme)